MLQYEVPNFPASPERGSHTIFFSRVFYIDRSDFRLEDSADFYRLTPQKEVGLRYFKPSGAKDDEYYLIKYKSHKADESGRVTDLEVEIVTHTKKPKAHYIQFVAQPEPGVDPKLVEFRIYEDLFKVDNPSALTNETWEAAINPNSLVIATGFVDPFAASTSIYHHRYNCTHSLTHARTHARSCPSVRQVPVRAIGLLYDRPRLERQRVGLQSHRAFVRKGQQHQQYSRSRTRAAATLAPLVMQSASISSPLCTHTVRSINSSTTEVHTPNE